MQTFFSSQYLQTREGQEADAILRSCVHCGFCTAACPTYLLTGNELDSPRGRIYLIKEMLEHGEAGAITRQHLDRCLTCQSCETSCPSNVRYHDLLNIGRAHVERAAPRSASARWKRAAMRKLFTRPVLFKTSLAFGRLARPVLPRRLKAMIPRRQRTGGRPGGKGARSMVILNGCVQNILSPNTNTAAARVLEQLGIQAETMADERCCGALSYHMDAQDEGLAFARRQIDRLCRELDRGAEGIVSTASGCGNFIKDYPGLLASDPHYAERARRVADQTRDLSEVLQTEDLSALKLADSRRLAFQCPCTLQHGQQLGGVVEQVLRRLGFTLSRVADGHLCCGSAGTYSLLQPEFAAQLRQNKIAALVSDNPDAIATANIGCQQHLAGASPREIRHWIEYIDLALEPKI